MSLNKAMLIGNAGKDPDVRHLESGVVKANFTMATSERYRDRTTGELKEQTEWHNIVCWRGTAEIVEKYVKKGTQVYVEGKITTRQYTDQSGAVRYITEIVADSLQLLGRRPDSDGGYQGAPNAYQPQPRQSYGGGSSSYGQQQYPSSRQPIAPQPAPAPAPAMTPTTPHPDAEPSESKPAPAQAATVQFSSAAQTFDNEFQEEDDLPF